MEFPFWRAALADNRRSPTALRWAWTAGGGNPRPPKPARYAARGRVRVVLVHPADVDAAPAAQAVDRRRGYAVLKHDASLSFMAMTIRIRWFICSSIARCPAQRSSPAGYSRNMRRAATLPASRRKEAWRCESSRGPARRQDDGRDQAILSRGAFCATPSGRTEAAAIKTAKPTNNPNRNALSAPASGGAESAPRGERRGWEKRPRPARSRSMIRCPCSRDRVDDLDDVAGFGEDLAAEAGVLQKR